MGRKCSTAATAVSCVHSLYLSLAPRLCSSLLSLSPCKCITLFPHVCPSVSCENIFCRSIFPLKKGRVSSLCEFRCVSEDWTALTRALAFSVGSQGGAAVVWCSAVGLSEACVAGVPSSLGPPVPWSSESECGQHAEGLPDSVDCWQTQKRPIEPANMDYTVAYMALSLDLDFVIKMKDFELRRVSAVFILECVQGSTLTPQHRKGMWECDLWWITEISIF